MVKHIIVWTLKDCYSADEKEAIKRDIKSSLEGLLGVIDGLADISVKIDALPSSNADLMLDSTFTSFDALKGYSSHPSHVAVANKYVRPFTAVRSCFDYEI